MDVDPLQDTLPPRYLYESDDEDDWDPTSQAKQDTVAPEIDVKILPQIEQGRSLIVASGRVGQYWGSGANLGEQTGAVHVNNIQVGLLFEPKWSKSVILVSEAGTTLPIWAMHPYATKIFDTLRPSRLTLLDSYASPSYITTDPILSHEAPVRYLTLNNGWTRKSEDLSPFASPNLLQTTSASFLTIASLPSSKVSAALFLVPSSRITSMPPHNLKPTDYDSLTGAADTEDWPEKRLRSAGRALFDAAGEDGSKIEWKIPEGKVRRSHAQKRGDAGDGMMYI